MSFAQVKTLRSQGRRRNLDDILALKRRDPQLLQDAVDFDCEQRLTLRALPKSFGNRKDWHVIDERGEFKVYAFEATEKFPASILKEYPMSEQEDVVSEANRLCQSSAINISQDVYGVYFDKELQLLYVHSKQLQESLFKRVERDGIQAILLDQVVLVAQETMYEPVEDDGTGFESDGKSACLAKNIMTDENGNLNMMYLRNVQRRNLKEYGGYTITKPYKFLQCFMKSTRMAHIKHALISHWGEEEYAVAINLLKRLQGGDLCYLSKSDFTRAIGESIIRWFDNYHEDFKSVVKQAIVQLNDFYFGNTAFVDAAFESFDDANKFKRKPEWSSDDPRYIIRHL